MTAEEDSRGLVFEGQIIPSIRYLRTSIIHTVNDYCLDSSLAECVLVFQIIWNLLCGSGRSERPRKTHKQDRFVLGKVGQVVLFRRKSLMQFHRWKRVANRSKRSQEGGHDDWSSGSGSKAAVQTRCKQHS